MSEVIELQEIQPKRLLWFCFNQNNSGGYYVEDDDVCELVFIQAHSAEEAIARARPMMEDHGWCPCCGPRWSFYQDDYDGFPVPTLYDTPVEVSEASYFLKNYKLHFYDGHVETHAVGHARPLPLGAHDGQG